MAQDISGLVPEIYYDLIARVAAGSLVVVIILSPSWDSLEKGTVTAFLLLLGLGYVVGHVLTAISVLLNVLIWTPRVVRFFKSRLSLKHEFSSDSAREIINIIYERIDRVANVDTSGGAILKKMEAGAALSDNLLSGWLVILIFKLFGGKIKWAIDLGSRTNLLIIILISLLLIASVLIRRLVLVARQDSLWTIVNEQPLPRDGADR